MDHHKLCSGQAAVLGPPARKHWWTVLSCLAMYSVL